MNKNQNLNSNFLKEFAHRGFFAACTHENELDEILANQKITAYIGFDCTAKSLHVGSLMQIMILRMLQKHGHKPLILLGGGTTKIGDPSGKDEARKVLSENDINENLAGIKKTLEKFISFEGKNAAEIVNNNDWLKDLNYLDFLRDVGRHFSINRMLSFDSVKTRLEREQPLSFLEFNYMILQAYDFLVLNRTHNCNLQIGGSDQWGNIINGVELIRRIDSFGDGIFGGFTLGKKSDVWASRLGGGKSFGLTSPLLTTADGKKMGKTADGAVWLDENMLSPFDYFQYFRNIDDRDVSRFLKLFVDQSREEEQKSAKNFIEFYQDLENLKDHNINQAKEILAFEATKICHGIDEANRVLAKAREIFIAKNSAAFEEKEVFLGEENVRKLVDIIFEIGASESKGAAKKLIEGKAVKINGETISDIQFFVNKKENFELSIGKKKFFKVIIK